MSERDQAMAEIKPLDFSKFNGVIFDLDGTLVDSVPDLTLALNDALTALNFSKVSEAHVRLWVGNGSRKLVERCLDSLGQLNDTRLDALHQAFLSSYQTFLCAQSQLYPGVVDLLTYCFQNKMAIGLVTNKPMAFVPPLLEALNIAHYFKVVVGGDSLSEKKPSPMPLLHVAQKLGVSVEACLMVGDSSSDVLSAQAANMPCVLLQQGYNQGKDLSLLNADWLLADVLALKVLFQKKLH